MSSETGHLSRPVQLTIPLAEQALHLAGDASPHQPRRGEWACSMTAALPASDLLIRNIQGRRSGDPTDELRSGFDRLAQAATAAREGMRVRFTDGLGHSRPHYHHLMLHLQLLAWRQINPLAPLPVSHPETLLPPLPPADADAGLRLMALFSSLLLGASQATTQSQVQAVLAEQPEAERALQPHTIHDALDHWTYHELVALHVLDQLADHLPEAEKLRPRLAAAARFHQAHTQPDYTTYQPWALAAFFGIPDTHLFAEQQLHDTQTHLSLAGRPGALLPAVLLTQACALLHQRFLDQRIAPGHRQHSVNL